MRRLSLSILAALTGFSLFGCSDDGMVPDEHPAIFASRIPSTSLPTNLDASRIYYYLHIEPAQPEVLLRSLSKAGLRPRVAWQPLPEGAQPCLANLPPPGFTVQLDAPDARILDWDFVQGTNALKCTTVYMRYQVLD